MKTDIDSSLSDVNVTSTVDTRYSALVDGVSYDAYSKSIYERYIDV